MPEHYIWWKPRDGEARGLIYTDGTVYVWPESEMTHADRVRAVGEGWCCTEFYVNANRVSRDGLPATLHQYCLSDDEAEDVLAVLTNVDPPVTWQRKQGMLRTKPVEP